MPSQSLDLNLIAAGRPSEGLQRGSNIMLFAFPENHCQKVEGALERGKTKAGRKDP